MKDLMENWNNFLTEKAETEKQKRFMHAVERCKEEGDCPSDEIKKDADSMTMKQVKDFTEHPVKEESKDKYGSEVSDKAQATLDKATKLQKISNEQIEEMVRQELEEKCWPGYQRVPGTEKGAPGSCEKKNEEKQIEEGEICDAGISYVLRTDPGGKDIHRGDEDTDGDGEKEIKNWSARAAQIASKYCKDPDYGKGRGKDAKDEQLTNEGDLAAWGKKEKDGGEEWVHSDGTPCGGGDKDGSQSRCKPAAKWKTMTKGEKAADNAKKKAGTKAGKQYVPATKKGKVTKAYTKRDESLQLTEEHIEEIVNNIMTQIEEGGQCTGPTQKASSTSKGKKWMQCVKNPDGKGYKRVHWGQKGVRVTGDSGNTKRKKSFRARHGCKDAKPGTAKYMACKDW
jgi:hypothetical protein